MTAHPFGSIIRAHCQPLQPRKTDAEPQLPALTDIRCVLFDIYGTLLISASGDIGSDGMDGRTRAYTAAIESLKCAPSKSPSQAVELLDATIRAEHARARDEDGVDYPEVDIVAIWRNVLSECLQSPPDTAACERFAVEFEVRANPVWPMPELRTTLRSLLDAGKRLGVVSNAQFFTPLLFEPLVGASLPDLGFERSLCFYSFEQGRAKPGVHLYSLAAAELERLGITPRETLFVGNDMLNDVMAAARVGFRTALFAGDARSLRRREGDPRLGEVQPDLVLGSLADLTGCLP